jgi:hypothetical protein
MSVVTTYDEMRYELKDQLSKCLKLVKELLDEDIWGYQEMKEDYATNLYIAIKKAKDLV